MWRILNESTMKIDSSLVSISPLYYIKTRMGMLYVFLFYLFVFQYSILEWSHLSGNNLVHPGGIVNHAKRAQTVNDILPRYAYKKKI